MLTVLKERLIDGLTIKSVKETNTKYSILFEFKGVESKADLPKTCAPNCENIVADNTIKTAVTYVYMSLGDYENAKKWLEK